MTSNNWLKYDDKIYQINEGETALDSMLRGGAELTFSCRKGSCHSCVLEIVSGEVGEEGQAKLDDEMRARKLFLPCVTRNTNSLEAKLPDMSQWSRQAIVASKTQLCDDVWQLMLEPETEWDWLAGQYINLIKPNGASRSYSIASSPDDYFIELHVKHYPDGQLSDWLVNTLEVGQQVNIQGPNGNCFYSTEMKDRPILLIATGTGAAPMLGIARDALSKGHNAPIHFYHGAFLENGLYLTDQLAKLSENHPEFSYSTAALQDGKKQQIVDLAFSDHPWLDNYVLFIAGSPDVVEDARIGAVSRGIPLGSVYADPFEPPSPYMPDDNAKISSIQPDPELFDALMKDNKLKKIVDSFYDKVFQDPRLAPFFHKITKERVAGKQYEFIVNLLTGNRDTFVEPPFNSHHWMIISDELFDYREKLFFKCAEPYNLPPTLIARWASLHETFRREIVKSVERGKIFEGSELDSCGYQEEIMLIDAICDGCGNEVLTGSRVRMQKRTGEIFCDGCEAASVPSDPHLSEQTSG